MTIFRILTLAALQQGHKLNKQGRHRKMVVAVFVNLAILSVITLGFVGGFLLLKNVVKLPLTRYMLTFLLLITQTLSIIACTASLNRNLYGGKDNAILLSFPVPYGDVYLSKLVVAYTKEYSKNLHFIIPIMLAFGFVSGQSIWFFVLTAVMTVVLPLLSVLVGALVGIPIMYLEKLLKKASFLYIVFVVAACALIMVGIGLLLKQLPQPLRIISLYYSIINDIVVFVSKAASFALFYQWVSNIVFGNDALLSALWLLLLIAGLVAANFLLSRPLFFKMASSSAENARPKQHAVKQNTKSGMYFAFLRKESTLTKRSLGVFLQDYSLIFAMPFLLYFINGFFAAISLSPRGDAFALAINVIISLLLVTASNTGSATALSREGGEFVLLKTAPAQTHLVTYAKITVNIVISTLLVVISLVAVGISGVLSWGNIALCFVAYMLFDIGHILASFQRDIKNPCMRDFSQTGDVSDNKNESGAIAQGFVLSLLAGLVAFVMCFVAGKWVALATLVGVALIYLSCRLYLFNLNLRCYFDDIEL